MNLDLELFRSILLAVKNAPSSIVKNNYSIRFEGGYIRQQRTTIFIGLFKKAFCLPLIPNPRTGSMTT
uniref:Uncharacterized protein n=1 Tax=Siphoviridae sp. ctFH16 TaxID=2827817 RepID=A0A8S5TN65_9CAUD|nr:MAG TPA: hypothetical protein [Siphoviridae sp. ctFH16]